MSVRRLFLAFALCAPAAMSVAEPAFAQAAEPLPDTGIVEFLPPGQVVGDGTTVTRVYAVAIGPSGAPIANMQPKIEVNAGAVTGWAHVGNGVYAFDYQPPEVATRTPVSITLRARAGSAKVERTLAFDVVPALAKSLTLAATPETLLLGTDLGADLVFTLVGPEGQPLDGADLDVRATEGEVKALKAEPNGTFTARYAAKSVNFPHLGLLTATDARQPDAVSAFAVLRMSGKVAYPVTAPSGASVTMTIADRTFGPVTAGRDGKASVPIEVPPGIQKATVTMTPAGGQPATTEIDLGIPASRRIALFPTVGSLPADHGRPLPLRALVRTASGEPDPAAKVLFEVSRGTVGVPRHLGDGVYEVEFAPTAEAGPVDVKVRIDGEDGQADALTFALTPSMPGHLTLTADPPVLSSGATTLAVVASPQTAAGAPLANGKLLFIGGGAKLDGVPEVAPDGTARARFLTNPSGPIEILVRPEVPASTEPMRHLVLIAGRERLANDGISGTPIVVIATDGRGLPVAGVPVSLDVVGADGQITPSVTTDVNGTGLVLYTAGHKAAVAGIRARSGNFSGATAVLQVPPNVSPIDLPVLGGPDQVAAIEAWSAATALVRVEHGGEVAAVVPPVEPQPVVPEPEPEQTSAVDEPWLRVRAGYVVASYAYEQVPNGDGGTLIDQIFAIGGPSGGKNATPMGFEADARVWLPFFPYIGAQVHYRAAYYGVTASIFGNQVANDALHDLRIGALGRYFFDFDQTRLHAGARVGLLVNDFIYFSEEGDPANVTYRYDTLIVPSLGLGGEIGADVWRFYGIVGFDAHLAYGSNPFGWSGDLTVGYDVIDHFTVDLGVETMHRSIELVGADSGQVRGTLTDHLWLARAGVGVEF